MSNMSDSSFYRFQAIIKEKMEKFAAKTEKEVRLKNLEERFKENTGRSRPTLWQKIRSFFYV